MWQEGQLPLWLIVWRFSQLVVLGSTYKNTFFRQHFKPWGQDRLQDCQWLQHCAANGLTIPYFGYLVLDVELCGRLVMGCGVLVVQDPPGGLSSSVPGVLGMNILSRCYQELFCEHGTALFDLPVVTQTPGVSRVMQYCQQVSVKHSNPSGVCVGAGT